jgi:ribosomal protein L37AE/L43A
MAKYAYCKVCDKEVDKPARKPMETFHKVIWVIISIASVGIGAIVFAFVYANRKRVYCPTCRTKVEFSSKPHKKPDEETEPLTQRERVLKKAGKAKEKKTKAEKETVSEITEEEEKEKEQTFCPYCGEDIDVGISKCPYCHSSLKTSY